VVHVFSTTEAIIQHCVSPRPLQWCILAPWPLLARGVAKAACIGYAIREHLRLHSLWPSALSLGFQSLSCKLQRSLAKSTPRRQNAPLQRGEGIGPTCCKWGSFVPRDNTCIQWCLALRNFPPDRLIFPRADHAILLSASLNCPAFPIEFKSCRLSMPQLDTSFPLSFLNRCDQHGLRSHARALQTAFRRKE
jgi:hypothetical protein